MVRAESCIFPLHHLWHSHLLDGVNRSVKITTLLWFWLIKILSYLRFYTLLLFNYALHLLTFWAKYCNNLWVKWPSNAFSKCCRWLSGGGQDQGLAEVWWHHHLASSSHFQILLPHGHHLLPFWLPELLHEVWILDIRQGQDRSGAHRLKGQRNTAAVKSLWRYVSSCLQHNTFTFWRHSSIADSYTSDKFLMQIIQME